MALTVQLSERQQEILRRMVEEFVATGEPVGSKTLVERADLRVSPSTVRAELAELDGLGLLTHPHTSAGRVPTEAGYRYFADDLLGHLEPQPPTFPLDLASTSTEVESALQATTEMLSQVTQLTALVPAPPPDFCHCSPKICVRGATQPFADRVVLVGDCGVTRLYKDGIGAAYRTSKAAAVTAVFEGVSEEDFKRKYWPACQYLSRDNQIGQIVFGVTRLIQKSRSLRRGVRRMVTEEQQKGGDERRMSMVLWDTFTGSAPYRSVFKRSLHPAFLSRFLWDIVAGNLSPNKKDILEERTG